MTQKFDLSFDIFKYDIIGYFHTKEQISLLRKNRKNLIDSLPTLSDSYIKYVCSHDPSYKFPLTYSTKLVVSVDILYPDESHISHNITNDIHEIQNI